MQVFLTSEEFQLGMVGIHKTPEPILAYKKVKCINFKSGVRYNIAVLEIPAGSLIVRAFDINGVPSNKLRTDKALVKGLLYNIPPECCSLHDYSFRYRSGETVIPYPGLNTDINEECAPGIHFFLDLASAMTY